MRVEVLITVSVLLHNILSTGFSNAFQPFILGRIKHRTSNELVGPNFLAASDEDALVAVQTNSDNTRIYSSSGRSGRSTSSDISGRSTEEGDYTRGQEVEVEIISFGPMGASVKVDKGAASGLILQDDLSKFRSIRGGAEVVRGELLPGYVMRCRPGRKLDISLRPVGGRKLNEVATAILEALEGSPTGEIPVGDKSSPNDVAMYFHGLSKREFKSGVGILFKKGLVKPGLFTTQLIEEADRAAALQQAQQAMSNVTFNARGLPKKRGDTMRATAGDLTRSVRLRNDAVTMFVGNLASSVTPAALQHALEQRVGTGTIVDIRISVDQDGKQRGFGYVEFATEQQVEDSLERLKGFKMMGRLLRLDFADINRSRKLQQSTNGDIASSGSNSAATGSGGGDNSFFAVKKSLHPQRDARRYDIDDSSSGGIDSSTSTTSTNTATGADVCELELLMSEDTRSSYSSGNKPLYTKKTSTGPSRATTAATFTLQIGNLAFGVTDEMLLQEVEHFAGKGSVASLKVVRDKKTGRSKGYAYVDVYDRQVADRIYDDMYETDILGRAITINDVTNERE